MKLKVLKCPECRANLEVEDSRTSCYCQYCGCKIVFDDETKTININKHITQKKRYYDEAKITAAKLEDEKDKRDTKIGLIAGFGIPLAIILSIVLYFSINAGISKSQGKVSVGYYKDLVGQDYKTVVAHFESAGFENIELIDLNDSGVLFWNDGKVEQISISGNTTFESVNYFSTNSKVVISYH